MSRQKVRGHEWGEVKVKVKVMPALVEVQAVLEFYRSPALFHRL